MQNIVLITRENEARVTHAAVFLCNGVAEAALFAKYVSSLSLAGGENLSAKRILPGKEYDLEKSSAFSFEDFLEVDDRAIQKVMRELDSSVLAHALIDAPENLREKILRNMSKRAACMLQEDMEYTGPLDTQTIEAARLSICEVYQTLKAEQTDDFNFNEITARFSRENAEQEEDAPASLYWKNYDTEKTHAVFVLSGSGDLAEKITVLLFDTEKSACNCCDFFNRISCKHNAFVYARHAEQMVEYETEKPAYPLFERIFECDERILGEALGKAGYRTVIAALKGLDTVSTEKIIKNLPERLAQKIKEEWEYILSESKIQGHSFTTAWELRSARQRIVDAINKIEYKNRKDPVFEVVKG